VLLLIKFYGATNTEIVKSLRKVLSIALSFAIYPKPVNGKYLAGMAATVASLVVSYRLQAAKQRKARARAAAPAAGASLTASSLRAGCSGGGRGGGACCATRVVAALGITDITHACAPPASARCCAKQRGGVCAHHNQSPSARATRLGAPG
jgi:hypothetical protein